MEEADVKQLISLIESAQLQYEVDESGTVSIVCDPVQLVGSSEEISDTVLASNAVSNTANILTPNLEVTLVSGEDDEKDVTDIIAISSVVEKPEESFEGQDENLPKVNEEKIKPEGEQLETCEEEDNQGEAGPQLQLSQSGHYFFQTPDGHIIQVLGPIGEGVDESSTLEEVEAVECGGSEVSGPVGDDQVQIFVVGGNSTEDVFLINTPDTDEKDAARSPVSISSMMLKSNALMETAQDPTEISEQTYMGRSVPSSSIVKSSNDHEEDLIPICQQEDSNGNGNLLNDSSKIDGLEMDKSLVQNISTSKPVEIPVASLSTKDPLLSITPSIKQCILLNSKTKQRLPLKMHLPRKSLGEGTVIQTDRGDMIAHNLSSVAKYKQKGPNGQKTILQNIAAVFGSVVKVLQPVEEKKVPEENTITKRLSILTCEDCGATLHSERSLQIHCRRYHKEWDDECFICGVKFLNMQYVRSHIQDTHSREDSFQCRLCFFKCSVLKEFLKHRKIHGKSQVCDKCGKKYITPKLFKEHVINCRVKEKIESKRKSVSNSANKNESGKEKDHLWSDFEDDFNVEYRKRGKKIKVNSPVVNDNVVESNSILNTIHNKKKSTKNFPDEEAMKTDGEFKIKSKHYHKQIKKMSVEPNSHRTNRTSRDRTHRCYLCFKLFSTAADLEAHKENYHLAKSDRPVRVKTDSRLDEKDEEDLVESSAADKSESLFCGASEQVLVKEEPVDFKEEFENVTIILDECMKSTHVIKPLCIACKAHTNTDFRKYSKWFNKIPDGHQSNALKKFQQFLPCVIDPQSLIEPWVLCKKCALLIDKIADMETKLNSMKCDLMSRFKGRTKDEHNLEYQRCNIKENTNLSEFACDREGSRKISNIDIDILEMNEGIGKSLADIEAYMKDTCEIMEITKPQKRPGRPRRQEIEKLTPVVSEEDERACMTNMVKYITKGILKKEKESDVLSSIETKGPEMQFKEPSTKTTEQVLIKNEKIENCFHSVLPNSESVFWDETASNSLTSLTTLQEDTLIVVNSNINKGKFNSGSLSSQVIKMGIKMEDKNLDSRSLRNFKIEVLDDCDQNSESINEVSNTVPSEHTPAFSSNTTQLYVADENTTKNHETFKRKKHDMPAVIESRDVNTDPFTKCDGDDAQDGVAKFVDDPEEISTSTDEHKDLQLSTVPSEEHELTDVGKHLKVLGKKRSQIRKEREKMCHRVEGTSKKPWICSECSKGFSTQRGACDHYAASHKGQSFSCDHCSSSYVRKRDLIGHYNKVHFNIKPYKCKVPECKEIFSSHGELYRHLQSVHSIQKTDTNFTCHICGATFAKKRYRDAHIPVCVSKGSDNLPHKCLLCEKAFKLSKYLQLHMRSVHCWKNEQFFCEICSKLLTDKRNFILHMKSHMGETKVSCEVCGKQFNRKSYLWTHMRVHNNQRPYGCNYCPKWFKQYSTWKNHERTHTGEKPFKCFVCEANFSTSSSAAKHVQYAHFNIRNYSCDVCKKTFISKPKLAEHIKVHTGEKPFKCQVCNRAFNKKNNLRTHMYIHSTNKRYRCELCGEGFMRRSTIESHIIDCHKLEFLLGSSSGNTNAEKDGGTVAVATAPFISLVGAEDISGEDSYIVIYEDIENDNIKGMQATVLAKDNTSNQVAVASKHDPLSADCGEVITSVESSDILTEVIPEDTSSKRTNSITNMIPEGEVSTITLQENEDSGITQVMEIDPSHFRLVTSGDTSGSIYTE